MTSAGYGNIRDNQFPGRTLTALTIAGNICRRLDIGLE